MIFERCSFREIFYPFIKVIFCLIFLEITSFFKKEFYSKECKNLKDQH
jgi:hypothetical protein